MNCSLKCNYKWCGIQLHCQDHRIALGSPRIQQSAVLAKRDDSHPYREMKEKKQVKTPPPLGHQKRPTFFFSAACLQLFIAENAVREHWKTL